MIAHVLHRLYLAGAEVLAAALARKLGDRYRFVFLCLDEVGPLGRELEEQGFAVVDLGRRPGVDLALAGRLRRAVREHRVSLLHAHQYTPFFYSALSRGLRGVPPILFTEHGRHYPDFRRPKRVLANRFLLRRGDRVTAVGHFVKEMLIANEGIHAARIEVIHNGIDPAPFDPDIIHTHRAAVRAELSAAEGQAVILQVARFHPVKDHATAIRAMSKVCREAPGSAVLALAGDGEKMQEARALAAELGIEADVRFLGVRKDVPRLMAGADVFMLSSLSEGISVTLLEAMAAALPIAATEVGGNGEVVEHEVTGLLSPRGEGEALGDHLLRLVRDPAQRKRMGEAGRSRLLERFTQQRMHGRFEELYAEMTQKGKQS